MRSLMYMLTAVLLLVWAFVNMVSNTVEFMKNEDSGEKLSIVLAMIISGAFPLLIAIILFVVATKVGAGEKSQSEK